MYIHGYINKHTGWMSVVASCLTKTHMIPDRLTVLRRLPSNRTKARRIPFHLSPFLGVCPLGVINLFSHLCPAKVRVLICCSGLNPYRARTRESTLRYVSANIENEGILD